MVLRLSAVLEPAAAVRMPTTVVGAFGENGIGMSLAGPR